MLVLIVSFVVPLVLTVLSLTSSSPTLSTYWLSYWLCYSIVATLEVNTPLRSVLPYYGKLLLYVWLVVPYFQGCRVLVAQLITYDEWLLGMLGKLDPHISTALEVASAMVSMCEQFVRLPVLDNFTQSVSSLVETQKAQQVPGFYALRLLAVYRRASNAPIDVYKSRSSWLSPSQSTETTPNVTPTKRVFSDTIPRKPSMDSLYNKFRKSSSTSVNL